MLLSLPLALLLSTFSLVPYQDADPAAAAIAPFLGEEVGIVVDVDLAKSDAQALARRVIAKLADEEDVRDMISAIDGTVASLKKAGARHVVVLLDPADMPGFPVVVVPVAEGADTKAVAGILTDRGRNGFVQCPASEKIRGAVVAGTPGAVARIRNAEPGARPELTAALAAAGLGAAIRVILIPSATQRRAIEESMPNLPPIFGNVPITTITRDVRFATLRMELEPRPILRGTVQAKDGDSAKVIQSVLSQALVLVSRRTKDDPMTVGLAQAFGNLKPEVRENRITLEADLEKTAELAAVPIRQICEGSRRSQCTNNLKQIALAMHNFHATHNNFPPAFSTGKDGKPLLSWRVHILPFLEQDALYKEFHLDEPWDSPQNKA